MNQQEWAMMVFDVAKKHPEYLETTFMAFSKGVQAQAEINSSKVANIGAALAMLLENPKDKKWIKLAKERLIESRLFGGTPFEKKVLLKK